MKLGALTQIPRHIGDRMLALIRPAKRTDRAQVLHFLATLQDAERRLEPRLRAGRSVAPAYYAQLGRRCAKWDGAILVADRDGQVVGLVAVLAAVPFTELDEPPGTYALVSDLVVAPHARRLGIGRQLLAHAESYARRRGATELRIGVLAANRPAVSLYQATGFRPQFQLLSKRLGRGAVA